MKQQEDLTREIKILVKIEQELNNILELPEEIEELKPAIDCLWIEVKEMVAELTSEVKTKG